MDTDDSEPLLLIPNGYPVWIDVAQATIGGAATAMRFELPLHAHNLPLMHRRETKLIVALAGELDVRVGRRRIALLKEGQAIKLEAGAAHRIHQFGMAPSTVGVVLWPGAVEHAFRELAAAASIQGYQRHTMIEILARYDVVWANESQEVGSETITGRPLNQWFSELPEAVAKRVESKWGRWRQHVESDDPDRTDPLVCGK
jgi:mannose-6-phosphate isomerase-like protein (cupin superfamily)